jgi:hypothetical protein
VAGETVSTVAADLYAQRPLHFLGVWLLALIKDLSSHAAVVVNEVKEFLFQNGDLDDMVGKFRVILDNSKLFLMLVAEEAKKQ